MAFRALRILLVDDDVLEARLLKANIERGSRQVDLAHSCEDALATLARRPYDAVVTDLVMPGLDGIELLRRIRGSDESLPVFILTAHATLERAVEGIQAGATDFLAKPVVVDALVALLQRAVSERPVREEVTRRLIGRVETPLEDVIAGVHPRLDEVRAFARQVAGIPGARVLITGESGTGKSVLARAIHDLSGAVGRFVQLNCAAIPTHLLESELFGHEKGAFTDAKTLKRGLIELAHEGTLLLDEVGALPLDLQAKLLTFLESQEIRRVGGTTPIPIGTRVVAATNEDLHARTRERSFRLDLLYRLDVASIEMPPLREIAPVIPELAERFKTQLSVEMRRPAPETDAESFEGLTSYAWPGNARELKNAVERALIFHREGPLRVRPPGNGRASRGDAGPATGVTLPSGLTLKEVERRYLADVLERSESQPLEEVAKALGISRKTLWDKRRRFEL